MVVVGFNEATKQGHMFKDSTNGANTWAIDDQVQLRSYASKLKGCVEVKGSLTKLSCDHPGI